MADNKELLEDTDVVEDKFTLIDDQGNEKEFTILSTFHSDETGKDYVFYYDESQEDEDGESEVYVSSYDENNNIQDVVDEDELEMIEEVFNSMMTEEEE